MLCSDCREEGVHPTGFRSMSSVFGFGCLVVGICAGYHAWMLTPGVCSIRQEGPWREWLFKH